MNICHANLTQRVARANPKVANVLCSFWTWSKSTVFGHRTGRFLQRVSFLQSEFGPTPPTFTKRFLVQMIASVFTRWLVPVQSVLMRACSCKFARASLLAQVCSRKCAHASLLAQVCSCEFARASVFVRVCLCSCGCPCASWRSAFAEEPFLKRARFCRQPSLSGIAGRFPHDISSTPRKGSLVLATP